MRGGERKGMGDDARATPDELIELYHKAYPHAWVRHHIESYDDFLDRRVPLFLAAESPLRHRRDDLKTLISIYFENPVWQPPTRTPHECRLEDYTYSTDLVVDVRVVYEVAGARYEKAVPGWTFATLPLLLRSRLSKDLTGECSQELGGYFIVGGAEKVLLSQEVPAPNFLHVGKINGDPGWSHYAEVKSAPEDGTQRTRSHRLVVGESNGIARAFLTIPGIQEPVHVGTVFRALGVTSDAEILSYIRPAEPERRRAMECLRYAADAPAVWTVFDAIASLQELTHFKSLFAVQDVLSRQFLPHVTGNVNKLFLLGEMVRRALLGVPTDRDALWSKRLQVSGDLCFSLWADTWAGWKNAAIESMDKRLTYDYASYRGERIVNLVSAMSIDERLDPGWWRRAFEGSFKGRWLDAAGVSQELERLSYFGTLNHLRKCNLTIPPAMKLADPHLLHYSQWGFFCPVETPDGPQIGLYKGLTQFATASVAVPTSETLALLASCPYFKAVGGEPGDVRVWANGTPVGTVSALDKFAPWMARRRVPLGSYSFSSTDNTYTIWTDGGRLCRPLLLKKHVPRAASWADLPVVWVDSAESSNLLIGMDDAEQAIEEAATNPRSSHWEIHPTLALGALTSCVPFAPHNAGHRNMFAVNHSRQAIGRFHSNPLSRWDTLFTHLQYTQAQLARTSTVRHIGAGQMHMGTNVFMAIMSYGGYNQEDSVILNAGSVARGLFHMYYFKTYTVEEQFVGPTVSSRIANPTGLVDNLKGGFDYGGLDSRGLLKPGYPVVGGETVLVGLISPNEDGSWRDRSVVSTKGFAAVCDRVHSWVGPDGLKHVKVRLRAFRLPVVGDKMSQRSSQKGTVGLIMPEADMPFDEATGLRPDLIINPHAIPSRMTVGLVLETVATAHGVALGCITDATAWTGKREPPPGDCEVRMVSGFTGKRLKSKVFFGPNYYLRLKHMVDDKLNVRGTGAMKTLTHQPVDGRGNGGGLRIGEMERDVLVAHGMGGFLRESMMDRSDGTARLWKVPGSQTDETVPGPWAANVAIQEVTSMHVKMALEMA